MPKPKSDENPFYPHLSEAGSKEAEELVEAFKKKLKSAAEDVIGELYMDVAVHIESDSWTNYRNKLMSGFRNYQKELGGSEYDFKYIRQEIFKDFREEIIQDMNQDLLKENESLKKQIEYMRELERSRYA